MHDPEDSTPCALHVAWVGHVGDMLFSHFSQLWCVGWNGVLQSLRTWGDIRDTYMSALLLACVALCAAVAAMPEALTGMRAGAEPLVAAQGTLIKYAGGPFNTAFISARPGARGTCDRRLGGSPFSDSKAEPSLLSASAMARTACVERRCNGPHGLC